MDCPIPSARDVRHFLEGFCLTTTDILTFTVSFDSGATVISLGSDLTDIRESMIVSGDGIETGTIIDSVDYTVNEITLDKSTTEAQTDITLSITKNTYLTDSWIINRRDRFVIPWIQKRTSLNITGEREITEYVSGNGLSTLMLSHKPIQEIVSLSYVNTPTDYDGNLQESVVLDSEQGILMSKNRVYDAASYSVFHRGVKNIKVVYKVGFEDICTEAPDVPEAILNWLAALALQIIGSRNGGGNINQPGYTQSFGDRGKYSEAIKMAEGNAMAILRGYFDYVGSP